MSLAWSRTQRTAVARALAEHPSSSPRCADAARAILPIARERDLDAHALVVEPAVPFGRCVMPKHLPSPAWHHHVLVHTEAHAVDALTGPDGHSYATYLETFFLAPEAHAVTAVDLQEDWL